MPCMAQRAALQAGSAPHGTAPHACVASFRGLSAGPASEMPTASCALPVQRARAPRRPFGWPQARSEQPPYPPDRSLGPPPAAARELAAIMTVPPGEVHQQGPAPQGPAAESPPLAPAAQQLSSTPASTGVKAAGWLAANPLCGQGSAPHGTGQCPPWHCTARMCGVFQGRAGAAAALPLPLLVPSFAGEGVSCRLRGKARVAENARWDETREAQLGAPAACAGQIMRY